MLSLLEFGHPFSIADTELNSVACMWPQKLGTARSSLFILNCILTDTRCFATETIMSTNKEKLDELWEGYEQRRLARIQTEMEQEAAIAVAAIGSDKSTV